MSSRKLDMKVLKNGINITQLTPDITEQELVTAVAMAAISRSDLPIEQLREKYLKINKNGESDYKRFLRENVKQYNHWSVLDHVLLHLNISGVSQWVNKLIETFNLPNDLLPIAITELSTRYVDFSNISSDDYYVPNIIKQNQLLLKKYKNIIDFQLDFYRESISMVKNYYVNQMHYSENRADIKSFDDCRNLLPDGTPTSVNISISFRALPEWIKKISIKYYDEKNEELIIILNQLIDVMKKYDFIYDIDNFEKVLSYCKKIYEKNLKEFEPITSSDISNYLKEISYKTKDSLNEEILPISLTRPVLFYNEKISDNKEISNMLKDIIIELNENNIYKKNIDLIKYIDKLNENDLDLNVSIDSTIDFGAYRDLSRHRGSIIYSSGLPYSIDCPFIIGLDTLYSLNKERFSNYIKKLTTKLITFLSYIRKNENFDEDICKFIFSYLIPMGAVKNFYIKTSLDQLLHLIKERTNSGAHDQYKNFALKLASDLSDIMNIHTGYLVDDENIKKQLEN